VIPQRTQKLSRGEVTLAVSEYGIEHPLTLVLVHGYPDSSEVWSGMVGALAKHYHVVTYDVRGCGQSTAPLDRNGYRLKALSADFVAVIDAVSPDRPVHLLAHDWGSIQSWESVTDPQLQSRIRSYTTISGPCLDHAGHWIRDHLRSLSLENWTKVGGQFLHSWYIWLFQLPLLAPTLWKLVLGKRWHRVLAEREGIVAAPSPTQIRDGVNGIELYRANIGRVALPGHRHTRVPVQQIIPLQDAFVTPEVVLECAQPWVQQLWSRSLPATHWAPLSQPEPLVAYVREFIDFVEGAPESAALRRARVQGDKDVAQRSMQFRAAD